MQILIFTLFGLVGPVPFASRPPRPLSRSRNHPTALTTVPEGQLPALNRRPLSTEQTNWCFGKMLVFKSLGNLTAVHAVRQWFLHHSLAQLVLCTFPSTKKYVRGCSFELPWRAPTRKPKIGSYNSILHFASYCPQDCRFRLVIGRMGT